MIGEPGITEKIFIYLGRDTVSPIFNFGRGWDAAFNPSKRDYYRERDARFAEQRNKRRRVRDALKRLEKAEAISYNKKDNTYTLTPSGWLKFMHYYNKHTKELKKSKKKDQSGCFIIIFDIPERHRRFRDLFRQSLYNLGCDLVQKSVFKTDDRDVFVYAQRIVANCGLDGHVMFVDARKLY